jgi:hypothetical protein
MAIKPDVARTARMQAQKLSDMQKAEKWRRENLPPDWKPRAPRGIGWNGGNFAQRHMSPEDVVAENKRMAAEREAVLSKRPGYKPPEAAVPPKDNKMQKVLPPMMDRESHVRPAVVREGDAGFPRSRMRSKVMPPRFPRRPYKDLRGDSAIGPIRRMMTPEERERMEARRVIRMERRRNPAPAAPAAPGADPVAATTPPSAPLPPPDFTKLPPQAPLQGGPAGNRFSNMRGRIADRRAFEGTRGMYKPAVMPPLRPTRRPPIFRRRPMTPPVAPAAPVASPAAPITPPPTQEKLL